MSFQIKKNASVYDICIVGSGAGGGMAAKVLSEAGYKIALMEAGPHFDPANAEQQTQLKWSYESPRRGAGSTRAFGDFDMAYGGWEIDGEPYTRKDGTKFDWFRSRMLGGRTNHWGRISLRFGPLDFKRKDFDGKGENWPIGYDDIKPWYDKVDKFIGVFGTKEGLPNEPDGYFLPPPKPRLHEMYLKKYGEQMGLPVIPSRLSILTKRIDNRRGACFFCNQCSRSCTIYGDFSSSSVLVKPALEYDNVDLFVNAMVREVLTDENGKATGVSFINKTDMEEYQVKAKVVILAASACGSARILLNSRSEKYPNGLGNSSGLIGHYLHDSTGADRAALIPSLMDRKRYNEDGVGGMHLYVPWWMKDASKHGFTRGYHIEFWGGMGMPSYGTGFGMENLNGLVPGKDGNMKKAGGYGAGLKDDVRRFYGAVVGMSGRGESIPQKDNYCELDPNVVDQYGIPVLRFHYKWTDEERMQAKHMHDTFEELLTNMGGILLGDRPGADRDYGLHNPGRIIHEVGTTRMGDDPKSSVVNRYNQLHDVDNVFVMDGGPFVSQADKNPTWTILALAWRASEYLDQEIKKMNV
ncbi:GMC family oxidoreductase [Robertkochia marina]|uniref:GMC family oxidoreductase n=1 Tax=Robertkochia marina TaxID=1227945 RepID=A0A4S3M205_9FLAO|nr:GMC family oxidoreductase [Robertkochia marina]THD69053.1 GMC family oxidoreductase [Robertkochia marina]TRZ44877.1 GMC family oxidoreductase [Robertkochia marina]